MEIRRDDYLEEIKAVIYNALVKAVNRHDEKGQGVYQLALQHAVLVTVFGSSRTRAGMSLHVCCVVGEGNPNPP